MQGLAEQRLAKQINAFLGKASKARQGDSKQGKAIRD
jgi:hypothetical protein